MPDLQIPAPGTKAAPLTYLVPGSVEMILKAAFATFNGAGAAGAFLPCLRVLSPAGLVVGEYITDSSVAAGSSAEVSFAPFLRGAASSTPAASATDFGPASYPVPLIAFASAAGTFVSAGVVWVLDAAVSSGGYVTKVAPANASEFVVLVDLHPSGAIFGFTFTYASGPDYGKFDIDIASIGYQLAARGSGVLTGKIQDVFHSGSGADVANYGPDPVFKNLIQYDGYSAGAIAEGGSSGTLTFIPGGAEGAILTTLTASTDAYTGLSISDGGPGWYALRFKVNGKNGASTNFRFRIISLQVLRVPDGSGF